jgi:probable F420-dependent oxidoreductase
MDPAAAARLVEERGYHTLFFTDHTHIPVAREVASVTGAPLQRKYAHNYDMFIAMTAAVLATRRIRVASACLVVQRDPITTAKEVASIDHLSGGRLDFGVVAGWNREEMQNHGTDPRTRMKLLHERVDAMKAIWTQDVASYHGRFVDFEGIQSWPKPSQRPHPPILVGGLGPSVLDRVLAFGDGWMPPNVPGVVERIPELRSRADRPLQVVVLGMAADAARINELEEAGADRIIFQLPSTQLGPVERALDTFESAVAEAHGE